MRGNKLIEIVGIYRAGYRLILGENHWRDLWVPRCSIDGTMVIMNHVSYRICPQQTGMMLSTMVCGQLGDNLFPAFKYIFLGL